jgi:predicted dienelactone hydrolase
MNPLRTLLPASALALAAVLAPAGPAHAQHAGWRSLSVPADPPITVALYYPTAVPARPQPMGPWQPLVAPGAPASEAPLKGLVLISHGTGGTEFNHHDLATRLAREGYLVAAPRHPGDNWQDRSLVHSGRYFTERPRQLSQVLDALLASPEWGTRIPRERIAAVGHSAGGYAVLALAGGIAEPARAARHCATVQDDPGFCGLAKAPTDAPATAAPATAAPGPAGMPVADPRIRAVVALAPMAVVFTPESLATVRVPVRVIMAERDAVLNGRYHGGHVAAHLPGAQVSTAAGAGHFAFMAPSTMPLPSAAGDAAADPAGFDRAAWLPVLHDQVVGFLAAAWR